MRRVLLATALLALAAPMIITGAAAHSLLARSSPARGAKLKAPPEAVTLGFSQAIEPAFSSVKLFAGDGAAVETGQVEGSGADKRSLRLALPRLGPGVYRVEWSIVSVDTHPIKGAFTFEIAP